jgi:hypothetical protein
MLLRIKFLFACQIVLSLSFFNILTAEEGMWTFDNPPLKLIQDKFGVVLNQEWLDNARLSCVKFPGGSGSFVSSKGLVMTNHHVASGQIEKLSTSKMDYIANGFYSKTNEEELKCKDLELSVLISMNNVTDRVLASIKSETDKHKAVKAREAEIAKIEKENNEKTGLVCDVVNLYHGGEYWVYRYKKYTDIRLVMAPEKQMAFFGGDADNFTYPRYNLDFTFLRIYENGKPIKSDHYFKWNNKGAAEDELVFVSGNPGSTNRLNTYSEILMNRDNDLPLRLKHNDDYLKILRNYAAKGKEQKRRAAGQIFGLENSQKNIRGMYNGLLDSKVMDKRQKEEEYFKKIILDNPDFNNKYNGLWDTVKKIIELRAEHQKAQNYEQIEGSRLYQIASSIVRFVVEIKKPDFERLEGYHDSQLERFKFRLFSPAPIYKDMEKDILGGFLNISSETLGKDNQFLKIVLKDKKVAEAADNLIDNTKLDDVEYRKKLIEDGEQAVQQSNDPMIKLALELDPIQRERTEWSKKNIESRLNPVKELLAQARFEVYGKNTYPDATGTLRISYGSIKGYPMNGTLAPYKTTLYGMFDRCLSFDNKSDYHLPDLFFERKDKLDLTTPVNFVTTNDIIGGNSGSPIFNKNLEIVGLAFDSNIEGLVGSYIYDITAKRTVCVHPAFIIESLRKLYDADELADEIEKGN